MIYYITKRHLDNIPNITLKAQLQNVQLTILHSLDVLLDWLTVTDSICFDKEFTNLNVLNAIPILSQFGDEENQFVVDDRSFPDMSYLEAYKDKEFIGHNIKIDISLSRLQGVDIRNVYDTMITEQRLGLGSKRSNHLEAVYNRRCNKELPQDKSLSEDFIKFDMKTPIEFEHIFYASKDVEVLLPIKKVQEAYIRKFNYDFLLRGIEFPLVPILADMELEGINVNKEGWKKVVEDNKSKLFSIEKALDKELVSIGFKSKKFTKERNKVTLIQPDLFGGSKEHEVVTEGKINYSSSLQVLKLFKDLKLELPTIIKRETNKKTYVKETVEKDSVQIEALQAYNLNHPNNVFKSFLEDLIEYKETAKEIDSFGEKFYKDKIFKKGVKKPKIGYLNKKTDRIHTIYRQCMTDTGRLASGDADYGLYNSQQIPAHKKYRTLFTLSEQEIKDDWWIVTSDLTGAEVVIMCAFAKDAQLYKWGVEEDDLHSPLATKCWRAIYNYRKSKQELAWITKGRTDNGVFRITSVSNGENGKPVKLMLTEDIIIDKHNNKIFRTDFKAVGFGVIYGAGAKTIAKTLNISIEEAKVIIKVIKETLPDTFKMVEAFSKYALNNSCIIHNKRTNSRKWFHASLRGNMSDFERISIESEARNSPIQGTQADMVKEMMVEIDNYYRVNKIANCPLLQIHDELVWKVKGKENCSHIARIMGEVATKYLEGFTSMKAEAEILHTWTK